MCLSIGLLICNFVTIYNMRSSLEDPSIIELIESSAGRAAFNVGVFDKGRNILYVQTVHCRIAV